MTGRGKARDGMPRRAKDGAHTRQEGRQRQTRDTHRTDCVTRRLPGRGRGWWQTVRGRLWGRLLLASGLIAVCGGPLAAQTTPSPVPGAPASGPSQPARPSAAPAPTRPGAAGPAIGPAGAADSAPKTPAPATGPLEVVPSPQERLLVPVPAQFNWLQRDAPSNPLLEALLTLQQPSHLNLSLSLEESVSDNFAQASEKGKTDVRTSVILGTVYRLEDAQKFLSLANTVRAFYQARTGRSDFGFANIVLNAGYQFAQFSLGLSDTFVREDNTTQDASITLVRSQPRRFLRNTLSPQLQYAFTPRTSATLGYTNTIVINEEGPGSDSISHAASAGLRHSLSAALSGGLQYAFSTTQSSGTADSGLTLNRGVVGNDQDSRSHSASANLEYQYDPDTSFSLGSAILSVERQGRTGQDSTTYSVTVGVRRVLFEQVSVVASIGPSLVQREGQASRVRTSWQLSLVGPIPLLNTPDLTLTLTTDQSVQDTVGEVDNVGLVLRQVADARLAYRPTPLLNTALSVTYTRTEFLEDTGTLRARQGRIENMSSVGLTASYALTNVISLTGNYRYQRRDARGSDNNFDENRLTLTVTGTFAVF